MSIWMMVVIWVLSSYLATLVVINLNEKLGLPVTPDAIGQAFFTWPFLLLYFVWGFMISFVGSIILGIHGRDASIGDSDE